MGVRCGHWSWWLSSLKSSVWCNLANFSHKLFFISWHRYSCSFVAIFLSDSCPSEEENNHTKVKKEQKKSKMIKITLHRPSDFNRVGPPAERCLQHWSQKCDKIKFSLLSSLQLIIETKMVPESWKQILRAIIKTKRWTEKYFNLPESVCKSSVFPLQDVIIFFSLSRGYCKYSCEWNQKIKQKGSLGHKSLVSQVVK